MHAERAGWSAEQVKRAATHTGNVLVRIDFRADTDRCPTCHGELSVHKSRRRTVVTLAHGEFEAREILVRCDSDQTCSVLGSEKLRRLVAPRQRYGYDLVVHVGLARHIGGRQRAEIRAELREKHAIELSEGSVSNLCDRFLVALEQLHVHRAAALRAAMGGGYPLHLDATCEKGRGGLFVALDGWRGWVLGATRIASEQHDHLQPLIEHVSTLFGDPLAIVRDLGDGIGTAVEPLRQRGVPDLLCHYHFLAAVGKKLLEHPYSLLRNALRRSNVRSDLHALLRELRRYRDAAVYQGSFGTGPVREDLLALVLWVLEGDGHKDSVFPFSLPHLHFVRRCQRVGEQGDLWVPTPRTTPERRALRHMRSVLARLDKERGVSAAIEQLDEGWQVFCELRDLLRLTSVELPCATIRCEQPHLPSLELKRLGEMERDLLRYKEELDERVAARQDSSAYAVVRRYLHRYGKGLFGHPTRRDDDGRVVAVVARTNNVLEHLFGSHKHELRRRLGRAHLARDLQQQPAQAALVANLRHPEYVRLLCGSLDCLPQAFASLHGIAVAGMMPLVRDHRDHRLHRRINHLLEASSAPCPQEQTGQVYAEAAPSAAAHSPVPARGLDTLSEAELRACCQVVFLPPRDPRLPPPGTVLTVTWENVEHHVRILDRSFEYRGETYDSLTSITRRITDGQRASGVAFFGLNRLADRSQRPAKPLPAKPSYPLGQLAERIVADLNTAGYGPTTIRGYLGHIQRFASHHMRSPEDMGTAQIRHYLLHLVNGQHNNLGNFRAARSALNALYRLVLNRPQEVEHISRRPEHLCTPAHPAHRGSAGEIDYRLSRPPWDSAPVAAATVS